MAIVTSQVVMCVDCGRTRPAELIEERIYPTGILDDATGAFQIRARRCAQEQECREAGLPCRWTGLNPNYDPFEGASGGPVS